MSSDELAFARRIDLRTARTNYGAGAWDALDEEGWLELLPEERKWERVDFVAAALDVIGAEAREIAYAPHIAAAATLAEAGADLPERPLALALDRCAQPIALASVFGATVGHGAVSTSARTGWRRASSAWGLPGLVDELLEPVMVSWADIDLSAATPLGMDPAALARHRARVAYVLAAEAAGAMRAAASATVDYLKSRRAFGVNLSSFQALQHRAVDIYTVGVLADAVVSEATACMRPATMLLTRRGQPRRSSVTRDAGRSEAIQLTGAWASRGRSASTSVCAGRSVHDSSAAPWIGPLASPGVAERGTGAE